LNIFLEKYKTSPAAAVTSLTTSESEHQVESGLLLNVVIGEGSSVFQLLSCEDQSLLIGWDALLVLDLGLHVLDGIRWLNIEGDGLTGEGLDEDLHTSSQSQHQVKCGFLLDVIVTESSAILELLSSEDESLLIGGNTFLILDLGLHILNSV